jgi:two-component system, NtrC family, nitrogen regulation response regulator GlnG
VLITGESGTGKELVAEAIHRHSPRREEPFVPVCVPALSATVLESELFGHVKGAFTGADHDRTGLLDLAAQGTAFFDEVGDVPLGLQVKLLRAMERQEVTPVGSTQSHRANFRLIAATNRDLTAMVAEGTFREDLFYRLNVFHLELPPLRDRREDIPPLVQHFLDQLPRKDGAEPMSLTDETLAELTLREWPGNVRELRNVVEHAAIVARGGTITPECLPATQATPTEQSSFDAALRDWVRGRLDRLESDAAANVYEELLECCEPVLFEQALNHAGGNRSAAARLLGIHRETLRQKLRKYFVDMD